MAPVKRRGMRRIGTLRLGQLRRGGVSIGDKPISYPVKNRAGLIPERDAPLAPKQPRRNIYRAALFN